jgi:hypothetical protein
MSTDAKILLKFANVQMAAEALFTFRSGSEDSNASPGTVREYRSAAAIRDHLVEGNTRASKFTTTQATEFSQLWEVVEHKSNTTTGFSGTLFRARAGASAELLQKHGVTEGELVLSFRSTEFADDAARDNEATNDLEIKQKGWAFGQIADMEDWYAGLRTSGKIAPGESFSVTGMRPAGRKVD